MVKTPYIEFEYHNIEYLNIFGNVIDSGFRHFVYMIHFLFPPEKNTLK